MGEMRELLEDDGEETKLQSCRHENLRTPDEGFQQFEYVKHLISSLIS